MMDIRHFILEEKTPVPADLLTWVKWYEKGIEQRVVKQEHVGHYFVSTVFLSLDRNFGEGPPLLFETMIFDERKKGVVGNSLDYQERYSTWELALEGHRKAVEYARSLTNKTGARANEK